MCLRSRAWIFGALAICLLIACFAFNFIVYETVYPFGSTVWKSRVWKWESLISPEGIDWSWVRNGSSEDNFPYETVYTFADQGPKWRGNENDSTIVANKPTKLIYRLHRKWNGTDKPPKTGWPNETLPLDCPVQCIYSRNHSFLNTSDAVIYNGRLTKLLPPEILNQSRNVNQIWALLLMESPVHLPYHKGLDDRFNWTLGFRHDTDVQNPYGSFEELVVPDQLGNLSAEIPTEESIRNKGMACWTVSNCHANSGRHKIVDKLKQFIQVDVYGGCADKNFKGFLRKKCTGYDCYKYLAKYYKFYLSFENSICTDYVTEKLFWPMKYGMVPIVYADSKNLAAIAPKGSYIDVNQFSTAKALADYLIYLDANPKEYLKYFEWRKGGLRRARPHHHEDYRCNFCIKLHAVGSPPLFHSNYESVSKWYRFNGTTTHQCANSKDVKARIDSM